MIGEAGGDFLCIHVRPTSVLSSLQRRLSELTSSPPLPARVRFLHSAYYDTTYQFYSLRKILAESAIELGATVRAPMKVVSVHADRERPWVTLESGEVVHGDVLVGCDGSLWKDWVTRTAVLDALGEGETCEPSGIQIYAYVSRYLRVADLRIRRIA